MNGVLYLEFLGNVDKNSICTVEIVTELCAKD